MKELLEYSKQTKFVEHDYIFEDLEHYTTIQHLLLPKIEGQWHIIFINIKLVEVKQLLDSYNVPEYHNLHIYLPRNKLEIVLQEYPQYVQKKLSKYDLYKQFLAELKHPVDKKAATYAYQASSNNIDDLYQTLTKIDTVCQKEKITLADIQKEFSYTKRVYTAQVVQAFLIKDKRRYTLYDVWLNELGMSYAYNSMYKYVKKLVHLKSSYINGEDVKFSFISKIDGVSISILYLLFVNSKNYHQLEGILYVFEHMNQSNYQSFMQSQSGL